MKLLTYLAAAALLAASPLALAQDKAKGGQLAKQDAQSLQRLAEADLAEVAAGKAAQGKASSDEVKKYAQHMMEDHGKMLEEKQQMAQGKGVKLPGEPAKKHKSAMKKLESLQGAEFDRQYMAHMVADHKKDIAEFQKQAKSGRDADLKAFAAKTLPTLQDHLKLAQTTHAAVRGGAKR